MTKRRAASILAFRTKSGFKYPAKVVIAASGTGTVAKGGVITVVAASGVSVATQAYLTVSATTNIGTLIGTA